MKNNPWLLAFIPNIVFWFTIGILLKLIIETFSFLALGIIVSMVINNLFATMYLINKIVGEM